MIPEIKPWKTWSCCLAAAIIFAASQFAVSANNGASTVASSPVSPATGETANNENLVGELTRDLLIESIVQIESAGKPGKVGSKGERGLMQIKRETWQETTRGAFGSPLPFSRAFEPALNRQVGSAYLAYLQAFIQSHRSEWKSDERALLLACYNAGPTAVERAGFDVARIPASTRDYVDRAAALHDHYLREYELPAFQQFAGAQGDRNS